MTLRSSSPLKLPERWDEARPLLERIAAALQQQVTDSRAELGGIAPRLDSIVDVAWGDTIRVTPDSGGQVVQFPGASPENRGETITVHIIAPSGTVTLRPLTGTINGAAELVTALYGMVTLRSDGIADALTERGGSALATDDDDEAAPVDAEYLLGRSNAALTSSRVATASAHITPNRSLPGIVSWDINAGSVTADRLAPDVTWAEVLQRGNTSSIYPPNIATQSGAYISHGDEAFTPVIGDVRVENDYLVQTAGAFAGYLYIAGTGLSGLGAATQLHAGSSRLQLLAPSDDVTITAGLEFRANAPGGMALETLASPSSSVGANDIVVNAGGGVGISSAVASPFTAITDGNIELSALNDLIGNFASGVAFYVGAHAGTLADGNDFVVNASGGIGLFAAPAAATVGGVSVPITGITGNDIRAFADGDIALVANGGIGVFAGINVANVQNGEFEVHTSGNVEVNAAAEVHLRGPGGIALDTTASPAATVANGRINLIAADLIYYETNAVERWRLQSTGAWSLAGDEGAAGEVLTSNGAGTPPTWQAGGGGVTVDTVKLIGALN